MKGKNRKLFSNLYSDERPLDPTSNNATDTYTSNYHRWASECREYLFDMVQYIGNIKTEIPNSIIKTNRQIEKQIHDKLVTNKPLSFQIRQSGTPISTTHQDISFVP